jgi:hypothetical protein
MRLRKRDLTRRVNGNLAIECGDEHLTSFAGLEILMRHLWQLDVNGRLRDAFGPASFRGDYPWVAMVRLFVGMICVGGRRLRHVRFLMRDPMMQRFAGLRGLPDDRTLGRWLRQFKGKTLECLARFNLKLVLDRVRQLGLRCLTIDLDGSVVSTGLKVAWAFRGHNPHHRKVPSYYPILAHLAQTGQILRVKNRPGNIHDGKRALTFLKALVRDLQIELGRRVPLEFRLDAAFFLPEILHLLVDRGCKFAVKVPMWSALGVKEKIQMRVRWSKVADGVSGFETELAIPKWGLVLPIACYRKKVYHRTRKNYQLDLFSPDDGTYEYSVVATNKDLNLKNLWSYMAGRGAQEKTFAELKTGFAFDTVPTHHYGANSAWQWLSVIAHNLYRDMQLALAKTAPRRTRKRTSLFPLQSITTARFEWLNVAGRLLRLATGRTLRLPASSQIQERYESLLDNLAKAA